MIYFDWKKILEASNGNVANIITIMRIITFNITPTNSYDKTFQFYENNFHGISFLINPRDVRKKGRAVSDKEVAETVGVAAFRNSYEYVKTKDTTLDLIFCQVSEDTITKNRLLDIRDGKIHFKYEETL